jgi:hypothetical protein
MIRKQIYLTSTEIKAIKSRAKKINVSESEYIRRVLDAHLEKDTRYFIAYVIRPANDITAPWQYHEEIIEEHPLHWSQSRLNDSPQEHYRLIFWAQISKADIPN